MRRLSWQVRIWYCKKTVGLLCSHLMKFEPRRITALLLLLVTITGLLMSFSEKVVCAGELPGAHETTAASPALDPDQSHVCGCPAAPSPSPSAADHFCTGDCNCPCQAPLSFPMISVSYSPLFVSLQHTESARYIPEVYLSKFIPPQIQA